MSKIQLDYFKIFYFLRTYNIYNYMKNSNNLKTNEPLQKMKFIPLKII